MFTYYQAENSTAEPALVNAIEQGLRAEHGVVTEDDILMELTSEDGTAQTLYLLLRSGKEEAQ